MATKEEVLDAISNMTVIELKELLDAFEEKFDVTAAAPAAVAVAAAPAGGEAAADAGDNTTAIKLANKAKYQAEAAVIQYNHEKNNPRGL